jgi:CRISPR/Cas system-associated exonuclease Cas4 (RecB family)
MRKLLRALKYLRMKLIKLMKLRKKELMMTQISNGRVRTNPAKGQFTPTSLETYMQCKRKYYFQKCVGLQKKEEGVATTFGSAIHVGVGDFYANPTLPIQERTMSAIKAFTAEWEKAGLSGDEKRSLSSGIVILSNYCKEYENESNSSGISYPKDWIEVEQMVAMPNGTTLTCRIDRIAKTKNAVIIYDTKTSSMPLTDFYFRNYSNSFQLSGYDFAVSSIIDAPVDTCVIDGLKVPYSMGKTRTGEPPINFARRSFLHSDLQKQEFINTYVRLTDEIMSNLTEDKEKRQFCFHQCQTACANYGGCEFLPICIHGYSHPSVQVDFTKEEGGEI